MTDFKINNKKHRGSLQVKHPRLITLRHKTQPSSCTSLIKICSEETQQLKNNLDQTNLELFKAEIKAKSQEFPSPISLIKPIPFTPPNNVTLRHLQQLNFPVLMYSLRQLSLFGVSLLQTSSFSQNFREETLQRFLQCVAKKYNSVAYHNFSHAFTLSLLVYQCLFREPVLRSLFSEEEYFYIMVAGFAHDLNHKGTNNNYQVKCDSALARKYHNESVLENMHISELWNILEENPQLNFMRRSSNQAEAKNIITRLILSTDMAHHFKSLGALKKIRKQVDEEQDRNINNRWIYMEQLFHACDIGNPTLDYQAYINWSALLTHEFHEQTILEAKNNVEVTNSFVYVSLSSLYKDQVWFLGNLVQPLWKQLSIVWPNLNIFLKGVEKNMVKVAEEEEKLRL